MKSLVGAHLPPDLCVLAHAAGHSFFHPTGPPAHNQPPDWIINELSVTDYRVVSSKATVFY